MAWIAAFVREVFTQPSAPAVGQVWQSENNGKFIAVVEVRMTMSGAVFVEYCACDKDGNLSNPLPTTIYGGQWRHFVKLNKLTLVSEKARGEA